MPKSQYLDDWGHHMGTCNSCGEECDLLDECCNDGEVVPYDDDLDPEDDNIDEDEDRHGTDHRNPRRNATDTVD